MGLVNAISAAPRSAATSTAVPWQHCARRGLQHPFNNGCLGASLGGLVQGPLRLAVLLNFMVWYGVQREPHKLLIQILSVRAEQGLLRLRCSVAPQGQAWHCQPKYAACVQLLRSQQA